MGKEMGEFSVMECQRLNLETLKKKVRLACKNAPDAGPIDPKSGLTKMVLENALSAREMLQRKRTLHLTPYDHPNTVRVKSAHEYPILVRIALRELLRVNHNLTQRELNSKECTDYYKNWYKLNLERHVEHELQHHLGAAEYTELVSFFGVEFYRTEGLHNFHPFISFNGSVDSEIYQKFVLEGPDQLSKSDRVVADRQPIGQ